MTGNTSARTGCHGRRKVERVTACADDGERQNSPPWTTRARRLTNASDSIDAVVPSRVIWFEKQITSQKCLRQGRILCVQEEHEVNQE